MSSSYFSVEHFLSSLAYIGADDASARVEREESTESLPAHLPPQYMMVREEIPLSKEDGEEVMRKRLGGQVSDKLANWRTISEKFCVCHTS